MNRALRKLVLLIFSATFVLPVASRAQAQSTSITTVPGAPGAPASSGAAVAAPTAALPAAANGFNQVQQMQVTATPTASPAPAIVGQNLSAPTPPPQPIPNAPASGLPPGFPSASQLPTTSMFPAQPPREERFAPSEVVPVLPVVVKTGEVRAVLRTSVGDITIKLNKGAAPLTVAHFVGLARGDKEFIDVKTSKAVKRPFYNGLTFHRAVKGTLIQTGCPFGNGRGGPGNIATIGDEIKGNMKFATPGLVAMAPMRDTEGKGTMKNSNGSQFFITMRELPEWNDQYTIFGEVEDGMDVVQKIANAKVGPTERPIKRIYLVAVEIIE